MVATARPDVRIVIGRFRGQRFCITYRDSGHAFGVLIRWAFWLRILRLSEMRAMWLEIRRRG